MKFETKEHIRREEIRADFKNQFSMEPMEDVLKYVGFLETRISRDPKEGAVEAMVKSFKALEAQIGATQVSLTSK